MLRTKFESPQSWLNYKNSFGTVVDRFRWEGGCIAEHVCLSHPFPPISPRSIRHVGNPFLTYFFLVGPGRGLPRGLRVLRGMAVWRGQQRGLQFWMSCRDWNLRSIEKPLHDLVSKWFSMSITYRLNRENPYVVVNLNDFSLAIHYEIRPPQLSCSTFGKCNKTAHQ